MVSESLENQLKRLQNKLDILEIVPKNDLNKKFFKSSIQLIYPNIEFQIGKNASGLTAQTLPSEKKQFLICWKPLKNIWLFFQRNETCGKGNSLKGAINDYTNNTHKHMEQSSKKTITCCKRIHLDVVKQETLKRVEKTKQKAAIAKRLNERERKRVSARHKKDAQREIEKMGKPYVFPDLKDKEELRGNGKTSCIMCSRTPIPGTGFCNYHSEHESD
jgi:hypothetical protein